MIRDRALQMTVTMWIVAIIAVVPTTAEPITWIGPDGANWNDTANWDPAVVPNNGGTLYDVRIDNDGLNDANVLLDMNATITSLTVDAGDHLTFLNSRDLTIAGGPITNAGLIEMASSGSLTDLILGSTSVTLTGDGVLLLGDNANNRITGQGFEWDLVIDAGHSIRGSGQVGLETINLINHGLVDANQPTQMKVDLRGAVDNNINDGTMQASGVGTLLFSGTGINNTGGVIQALDGAVTNLSNSHIRGGTLTTEGSGEVRVTGNTTTLENITNTGLISVDNTVDPRLSGTITNSATIAMNSDGGLTDLTLATDPTTLTGTGAVVMSDAANNRITGMGFGWDLINDVDHTIRGSGQLGVETVNLVNRGLIDANQPTALTVDLRGGVADNINSDTMQASAGGTLVFSGTAIDNTNGTIQSVDASVVNLRNSHIRGGLLTTVDTGEMHITGNTTTLEDVTNTGTISVDNTVDPRIAGTMTNNATIAMNSAGGLTDLTIATNPTTLTGTGVLAMSDATSNRITGINFDWDLINDVDHTIRGSGQLGVETVNLVNRGLIDANQSAPLTVDLRSSADNNANDGVMQASGGGTLVFSGTGIDNSNGTIQALDTSFVNLTNSHIRGGLLTTVDTGEMHITGNNTTLEDVTNTGTISVDNNVDPRIAGTMTNDATIELNSAGAATDLTVGSNPATLSGPGTLLMGNNANNRITSANLDWVLINDAQHTIRGAGNIGANVINLTNDGLIDADQPTALTVDTRGGGPGSFNNGVMQASAGGTLSVSASTIDNTNGIIQALDLSLVEVSNAHIIGGLLTTQGAGEVRAIGAPTLTDVTNTGLISVPNSHDPRIRGVITNNATIAMNSEGASTDLTVDTNPATLSGNGVLAMGDSATNRLTGTGFDWVLINDAQHTIRGAGNIGINVINLTNNGLIDADQATALTVDTRGGAPGSFNNGIMQASGGGILNLWTSTIDNTNGTIQALDASFVDINNTSHIIGGLLTTEGTGEVRTVVNPILQNVTNTGLLSVTDNSDPRIRGVLTNNAVMTMNSVGNGTDLTVDTNPATLSGGGALWMGDHVNNRITGTGFNWVLINDSDHTIRGSGNLGMNTIDVMNRGTIIADQLTAMTIDHRSSLVNTGLLRVTGDGSMTIAQGGMDNRGEVLVDAGRTLTRAGNFTQTGGSTIVDGDLTVNGGVVDLLGGTLGGTGAVNADVDSGGRVAPGDSVGELTINGTYTQQSTAVFRVEIGGILPGEFDVLTINGAATLDGVVLASVVDGYVPNLGDTFEVMTFNSRAGVFALPAGAAGPGRAFDVQYSDTSVTLIVVDCTDEIGPSIVHADGLPGETRPFSGYIDPRSESDDGITVNGGLNTFTLVFDEPVFAIGGMTEIAAASVSIMETGGGTPPNVANVDVTNNPTIRVTLDRIITLQEWTTIIVNVEDTCGNAIASIGDAGPGVNEPDRLDIGYLPADVDQTQTVGPFDLLKFRQLVNSVATPTQGTLLDFVDTDRTGDVSPFDLLAFRRLVNGVEPATRAWAGAAMDNTQP